MFRRIQQFWSPEPGAGDPPTPPAAPPPAAPPADPPAPPAAASADPPAPPTPGTPPAEPPAAPPATPPAPPAGPPERYELAAPAEAGLDAADLESFATFARAKGMTQEQAQAFTETQAGALMAQRATLKARLAADPELSGPNKVAHEEQFLRAMDKWAPASTPEGAQLRSILTKSGYWDAPEFRSLMSKIGRAGGEDPGLAAAGSARGQGAARKPTAEVMFDK